MWGSKGRSGYGESTIGGDYDSWDGLSSNGKQWKNESTHLPRNLSGADYWHLRKQNRPTEAIPESLHMLDKNKANINAYADKVQPEKPVSKVSIKNRILPQFKRLTVLQAQMIELEQSYKAGEMDISEYSLLRDCLVAKKERAEVLYRKAINVKPVNKDEDYIDLYSELPEDEAVYEVNSGTNHSLNAPVASDIGVRFIDELSHSNSLKKPLKIACTLVRTAVNWSHKAATYYKSLKEV